VIPGPIHDFLDHPEFRTGFVVGAVLSMALAYVIGRPILRLTGYFLALGTLALSAIASALFFEWDWLTGGTLGIGGIPKLELFGFALDRPSRYYFFVWILAFGCMALQPQSSTTPIAKTPHRIPPQIP